MEVLRCFLLGVLLEAGTSLAVDVNWLTGIVKAIRKEYRIEGQFCLVANIPLNADRNALKEILRANNYENKVKEVIGERNSADTEVYESDSMVVARPSDPQHAECRVLPKLQQLCRNSAGHFLLIYSYLSPCSKCADWNKKYNILKIIERYVNSWADGAFVFTKVYNKLQDGSTVPKAILTDSLNGLADSMGGLQYIFRCDRRKNSDLECHSCSAHNNISEFCIKNNIEPEAGSSGRERSQSENRSRSRGGNRYVRKSSSKSRSRSRGGNRYVRKSSSKSRSKSRGGNRYGRKSSSSSSG